MKQVDQDISKKKFNLSQFITQYVTIVALVVVFIVFALISDRFTASENLLNIIKQTSLLLIVALGVTIAMGAGEFDMCTGNVCSLGTILTAALMSQHGWGLLPTLLFVLVVGIVIGLTNSFFTVIVGIPSIIVTLGMSKLISGIASAITEGKAIYGVGIPKTFTGFAAGSVGPIANLSIVGIIFIIVTIVFLDKTLAGRYIYATGGNSKASKLSGVNTVFWRSVAMTLCSVFSIIAGILLMARLGTGSASAGTGYTLDAVSAVFIGMTCIRVGRPNVIGTIIGAFLVAVLTNGLNMMGVTYYYQEMVTGIVMIAAITITARRAELRFFSN